MYRNIKDRRHRNYPDGVWNKEPVFTYLEIPGVSRKLEPTLLGFPPNMLQSQGQRKATQPAVVYVSKSVTELLSIA